MTSSSLDYKRRLELLQKLDDALALIESGAAKIEEAVKQARLSLK